MKIRVAEMPDALYESPNSVSPSPYFERRSLLCYRARRADGGSPYGYCYITTSTTEVNRCLPESVDPVAFGGEIVTRRDFCHVCSFSSI